MSRISLQPHRLPAMRRAVSLAVICLIVAGSAAFSRQGSNGFAAPSYWLLAMLSCMLVIPLKTGPGVNLQRVLAAYIVTLCVDYLSDTYWPCGGSLQIAAGLPVVAAAVLAAWIIPRQAPGGDTAGELTIAAGVALAVIATLLLATGLLVHYWYGFGAEPNLGVFAQLAMALVAGIAVWRLADDATVRTAIGAAGIAAYSWMAVS